MSLNQKYTWKDFLKDNPEAKEKGLKSASKEGRKAFETAFKTKVKEYLQSFQKTVEEQKNKLTTKRNELTAKIQTLQKQKNWSKARFYQKRVGKKDAAISRLSAQIIRAKEKLKKL